MESHRSEDEGPESSSLKRHQKSYELPILLSYTSSTLYLPLVARIVQGNDENDSLDHLGTGYAYLICSYFVSNALGSIAWKRRVESLGPASVVNFSLWALVFGHLALAFATSLQVIVAMRLVIGLLNGITIAGRAYSIDSMQRTSYSVNVSHATVYGQAAMIIGPFLGGSLTKVASILGFLSNFEFFLPNIVFSAATVFVIKRLNNLHSEGQKRGFGAVKTESSNILDQGSTRDLESSGEVGKGDDSGSGQKAKGYNNFHEEEDPHARFEKPQKHAREYEEEEKYDGRGLVAAAGIRSDESIDLSFAPQMSVLAGSRSVMMGVEMSAIEHGGGGVDESAIIEDNMLASLQRGGSDGKIDEDEEEEDDEPKDSLGIQNFYARNEEDEKVVHVSVIEEGDETNDPNATGNGNAESADQKQKHEEAQIQRRKVLFRTFAMTDSSRCLVSVVSYCIYWTLFSLTDHAVFLWLMLENKNYGFDFNPFVIGSVIAATTSVAFLIQKWTLGQLIRRLNALTIIGRSCLFLVSSTALFYVLSFLNKTESSGTLIALVWFIILNICRVYAGMIIHANLYLLVMRSNSSDFAWHLESWSTINSTLFKSAGIFLVGMYLQVSLALPSGFISNFSSIFIIGSSGLLFFFLVLGRLKAVFAEESFPLMLTDI